MNVHVTILCLRNKNVRKIVEEFFFESLQALKFQIPGASITRPAAMIIAGRQKQKRIYTCSYCRNKNHNRKTCPYLRKSLFNKQNEINSDNEIISDNVLNMQMTEDITLKDEIEELCHLSFDQIAIYNAYSSILRPFIFQIAEEKDPNDIPTWNFYFTVYPCKTRIIQNTQF